MNFLKISNNSFNSSDRLYRIWYLRKLYFKIITKHLRQLGIKNTLISQFPFFMPDAEKPPSLSIEFTNHCNLKCPYCTSPFKIRRGGFMDDSTFGTLVKEIKSNKIKRVRIVGNGEPTIHPSFSEMLKEIKSVTPVLSLTTNGQFIKQNIVESIVNSQVNILNVSVDSMDVLSYRERRIGGDFTALLEHLQNLKKMKNRINKKMLINIRVMITPSDVPKKDLILKFWNEYGDIVSTQFVTVIKFKDQEISFQDQFNGGNEIGRYPKCSLPFKTLDVLWNGDIPLCTYSEFQMGTPGGLILGNINKKSISEIWQDPIIKKYRDAHRNCKTEDMPICNGCIGT